MYDKCFVCDNPINPITWGSKDIQRIECEVCLPYRISEAAVRKIHQAGLPDRHIFSGVIRELNETGRDVIVDDLETIRDFVLIPNDPLARIDRILRHVSNKIDTEDAGVRLFPLYDYSVGYAKGPQQFTFLVEQAVKIGYLENAPSEVASGLQYRLTLEGWKRVDELKRNAVNTNQAFIAMSFDSSLRMIYLEGVKPALEETGYVPLRLDDAQYNEKVDDRIVADIRKSGLMIADFTKHSPGVYFEAGLAVGLGIPVIWTCSHIDIDEAHFDTRQYNHIVWEDADELREKLIARIEATVPLKDRNNQNRK